MKARIVVLKQPLNIGELGLNGIRSLGAGRPGHLNSKVAAEVMEVVGDFIKVTSKGHSALIPMHNVDFILLEKEE